MLPFLPPVHLYIHVPFCARRCSYCDFAIAVRRETPVAEFVAAVRADWERSIGHPSVEAAPELRTVYFGGGTPSRLPGSALAELIGIAASRIPLASDAEITIEANPDDVTADAAAGWAAAGVNRVSLGVQSHEPRVLEWMHRTHRAEQVPQAISLLREAGIDNISVDLIFSLPEGIERDWDDDFERTLALTPDHISLYGLTVEPHTPLARWVERGDVHTAPDDRYAAEYLRAHRLLTTAGFEHYEVSNAGLPGKRSRHNSAYWSGAEYLGIGPSAHSLLGGVRSWRVRNWADYAARALAGEDLVEGFEELDGDARRLEQVYLGLRTDAGLPAGELAEPLRRDWIAAGWGSQNGGIFRLTAEGWLRLDALVAMVAKVEG